MWWLTPVIPGMWEAYIGGLSYKASPRQKLEMLSEK
jgi:hypothetical protein